MRLMFTALSISSMPIKIRMALRWVRAPYKPMPNKTAANASGYVNGMLMSALLLSSVVAYGDDDGAYEGDEQKHRRQLKRNDKVGEQSPPDHAHRVFFETCRRLRPSRLPVNEEHDADKRRDGDDGQHRPPEKSRLLRLRRNGCRAASP